ncbi:hypothetical protein KJ586_03045 [Patescibacteria group bacterium]|nr:hypothetical protein [Patescibacteria group bacterium]MBU4455460.1 hypothetical protein [Patescibacteria group bacterium]MCG2690910.1 hypothetical protein [Candidatus Parcubacteria bacterium]
MLTNNFAVYGVKILAELARDIVFFPLWWYSKGLVQLLLKLKVFLKNREKSLALLVWIKNIHKPMYGQYDWQGMLISFFMRLFQIIVRGIAMLFWLAAAFIFFWIWVLLPIFVMYEIVYQLMP